MFFHKLKFYYNNEPYKTKCKDTFFFILYNIFSSYKKTKKSLHFLFSFTKATIFHSKSSIGKTNNFNKNKKMLKKINTFMSRIYKKYITFVPKYVY